VDVLDRFRGRRFSLWDSLTPPEPAMVERVGSCVESTEGALGGASDLAPRASWSDHERKRRRLCFPKGKK